MNDHPTDVAPPADSPEDISPEVQALVGGDHPAEQPTDEQVTPSEAGEKPSEDTTKENISEKTEENKKPDTESKTEEDDQSKKKEDVKSETFKVAGRTYNTLDDAIGAVNSISGENTRLVGEVKLLNREKQDLSQKISEVETLLNQYAEANKAWKEYYEGNGEKPKVEAHDIEALVAQKIKQIHQEEEEQETKQQFSQEIDEIVASDDFLEVRPFFEELMNDYDGVPNISPKKIYERAQALHLKNKNKSTDPVDMEKEIEERVRKELAKREAGRQGTGGSGGGPPSTNDVSDEVMAVLG